MKIHVLDCPFGAKITAVIEELEDRVVFRAIATGSGMVPMSKALESAKLIHNWLKALIEEHGVEGKPPHVEQMILKDGKLAALGNYRPQWLDDIVMQVVRGEIDPARIPPEVASLIGLTAIQSYREAADAAGT